MSHYGIVATHWNVDSGDVDEVQLHKIVQKGEGQFGLSPGELIWCANVAELIDRGDTVWIIVSDGRGKYRNTNRVRADTKDGGRRSLYSCTKDGRRTTALADLPRYVMPGDSRWTTGSEPAVGTTDNGHGEYPLLTRPLERFDPDEPPAGATS